MGSGDLLIVAGEASGDLLGGRLLSELRELRPGLEPFGLGGDELREAGLDAVAHSSEISVVGITEALAVLPRARRIFAELLAQVERRRTRTAVLVDFPEFNLRLAKALKKRGVRVLYYVSPQIWAWRRYRVHLISRVVDRMLVVFPFEVDFYRRHGVDAVHVGHPLVDEVPRLPQIWDAPRDPAAPFHVSLLPGSRRSEIMVLLPILLRAAVRLRQEVAARFSLIRARTVPRQHLETEIARSGLEIDLVSEDRFRALASSHLALCAAGTATLEVGLLGTPMVVTHRIGAWSYLLGRLLVRLPHASLVNLILDREAVPELLQWHADSEILCREARALLHDGDRIRDMRRSLAELRGKIGPSGASRRAASEVSRFLANGAGG